MKKRTVSIFTNRTEISNETVKLLHSKLEESGFSPCDGLSEDSELIMCIGGDGAFLAAVHECGFPPVPFVGVNTGHLGFFQEIFPNQVGSFIEDYKDGKYHVQRLKAVEAGIVSETGTAGLMGLNEIVIKGRGSYTIHLDISIGGSFIQRFSGDGILVASPAGSTAYNYSLGGCIVDPRLSLLQVTPIAPMNTTAYRSFTSSILLPAELSLGVTPERVADYEAVISADGIEHVFRGVKTINISYSETVINLIRLESYDFWNKVKTKFLDDAAVRQ